VYNPALFGGAGILHSQRPNVSGFSSYDFLYDFTWFGSFPFESTYASVERMSTALKSLISTVSLDAFAVPYTTPPQPVNRFVVYFAGYPILSSLSPAMTKTTDQSKYTSAFPLFVIDNDLDTSTPIPLEQNDIIQMLFGFGDQSLYYRFDNSGTITYSGWTHLPTFRKSEVAFGVYGTSPLIRGWRYGLVSGFPTYSKAHWRKGRFGQPRDMLEQRPDTVWYYEVDTSVENDFTSNNIGASPVYVKFLDYTGKRTNPELTWSSNLSMYATSSLPYFDGQARNRNEVDPGLLNNSVIISM
jgi:hypothetical protein